MPIRVYNTLTRRKDVFEPVSSGKVGIYVCGPTVYSYSHIGHMVGPVIFDAIKRYFQYSGYDATLVVNITDIDDKIINRAAEEKTTVEELAERVTRDYKDNLTRLHVSVDHFPHATKHVADILAMIAGLIDKGYAYAAGGDVYFDVSRDEDYGKLSNRRIEELLAGSRKEVSDLKRGPADFALWKGAKPGEPSWESPWGPGRPGWHIECSAMSMKLLGETFDIHGGGLDLCFPHHEDEIAQSESLTGKPFARYWMHNGLMQRSDETRKLGGRDHGVEGDYASQEGGKMSKSKGNVVTIRDLLGKHSPETVRFFLLSTHYRRPIDFSDERIAEVGKGLARFHALAERASRLLGTSFYQMDAPKTRSAATSILEGTASSEWLGRVAELRNRFLDQMDDDFNTGGAIGTLFELLPVFNRYLDDREQAGSVLQAGDGDELRRGLTVLKELTQILGIMLEAPSATATHVTESDSITGDLLDLLVEVRQMARKTKNFPMSDRIRDRLKELGVVLEDGRDSSSWKWRPNS